MSSLDSNIDLSVVYIGAIILVSLSCLVLFLSWFDKHIPQGIVRNALL